ncbi:TerD family protein [Succinimonas amylolytica]|uniref:TerD family protein n=1 Tax=Succinimonas amylolytica TaxID=83769 RepID=UPI000363117E|nr:TerD family protein [Succinimonas amylolytica]
MINLKKGGRFNLKKDLPAPAGGSNVSGAGIVRFCVGCKWGKIKKKSMFIFDKEVDVDLDLSCVMFNDRHEMIDWIYSPCYNAKYLASYGYSKGKLVSAGGGLQHSGDDLAGGTDSSADNEIIQVDISKVNPDVSVIIFFLNYVDEDNNADFSKIPYASIRLFEGTPDKVETIHATYNVAADPAFKNTKSMIMGKLVKQNGQWAFDAIGDALKEDGLCETINKIKESYV